MFAKNIKSLFNVFLKNFCFQPLGSGSFVYAFLLFVVLHEYINSIVVGKYLFSVFNVRFINVDTKKFLH